MRNFDEIFLVDTWQMQFRSSPPEVLKEKVSWKYVTNLQENT